MNPHYTHAGVRNVVARQYEPLQAGAKGQSRRETGTLDVCPIAPPKLQLIEPRKHIKGELAVQRRHVERVGEVAEGVSCDVSSRVQRCVKGVAEGVSCDASSRVQGRVRELVR